MSNSREHEIMRRQLWISVATATAGSDNCVNKSTVYGWADAVLEKFDEKFKPLPEEIKAMHPAAPDGMVLVPEEPTPEMREAGNVALMEIKADPNWATFDKAFYVYRAMIAVAPTPKPEAST